jgi:RimJ/RimL family protein N-acetyltransferase
VAVSDPENERARRLLCRLGLRDQGLRRMPGFEVPLGYFAVDYPAGCLP